MKKTGIFFAWIFLVFGGEAWLIGNPQEEPIRKLNFDRTMVSGRICDENNKAVPGIKVEIRLALRSEIPQADFVESQNIQQPLLDAYGTEVFAWGTSDEKGDYAITGVPVPGAYFLLVRGLHDYFETRVPIIIWNPAEKNFKADIVLRARRKGDQGVSQKVLKETALEEIAKAEEAMKAQRPTEAVQYFRKALDIEPKSAEIHYKLAFLLRHSGELDEAIKHFKKALHIKPEFSQALFFLGETLNVKKDYKKSNECLMKLLTNAESEKTPAPIKARICYLVGVNKFNLKQPDRAIPFFSKAIELDPKIDSNAYIMLGNSFVIIKDGINAINNYKKYVELYPDAPNIQQVKAILEKLEAMYKEEKN